MELLDLVVMTAGLIVNIIIVATYDGQPDQKKQAAKSVQIFNEKNTHENHFLNDYF